MNQPQYEWIDPSELYVLEAASGAIRPQTDEERLSLYTSMEEDGFRSDSPIQVASDGRGVVGGINRREIAILQGKLVYIQIYDEINPSDDASVREFAVRAEMTKGTGRSLSESERDEVIAAECIRNPLYTDNQIASICGTYSAKIREIRVVVDPDYVTRNLVGRNGNPRKPLSERKPREKEIRDYGLEHLQTGIRSVLDKPEMLNTLPADMLNDLINLVSPATNAGRRGVENGKTAEDTLAEILESLGFVDETDNFKSKDSSVESEQYFIRQYGEALLWGGTGRQDFLVVIDNEDGTSREFIIEVRSQDEDASSPFGRNLETWERSVNSDVQDWILVVTGDYWLRHEGSLNYLASKNSPVGKTFSIVRGIDDFGLYATKNWT